MPSFHLILQSSGTLDPRRIDFEAGSIDEAFQTARNRTGDSSVELWEGNICHVRMSNSGSHLWKLYRRCERTVGNRMPNERETLHLRH